MFTLLTDGLKVEIRAIGAEDASMLQAFFRRLSSRSRHFRFFSAVVDLPLALLERLVNQDRRRGLALVALSEQLGNTVIIAEARCVLDRRSALRNLLLRSQTSSSGEDLESNC